MTSAPRWRTCGRSSRDLLRRVVVRDDAYCDEIAAEPLRYGDANGDGWADVIDMLTMHPDVRRKAVRLLAEINRQTGQN